MKRNQRFGLFMAVCMLAGSCIAPFRAGAEDTVSGKTGDANIDGFVDVADAVLGARFAAEDKDAKLTDQGRKNGDVNGDGELDSTDVAQILEFIAHKRTSFAAAQQPAEKLTKTVDMMAGIEPSGASGKEVDDAFVTAQFDLTAKLLKEISQNEAKDQNILISPLSLSLALGMTANGAKGETRAEMQKLLGGEIDIETMNAYYYDYVSNLPSTDRERVEIANSIWIKDDESRIVVPKDFLQTNKDYFDAGVFRAPFDDGTIKDINDWTSRNTGGMIPEVIRAFNELEVMDLINTLYFDAAWKKQYEGYQVTPGTFYLNEQLDLDDYEAVRNAKPEEVCDVDYMSMQEDFYVQDEKAVGFVKPYGSDNYSFVGLLPNDGVTVQDYIDSMDGASLKKLMDSKKENPHLVYTCLPKFKCSYEVTLNDTLKALGMKQAFEPTAADFSGLNELGETWIGSVLQKTVIEVNEVGTRASAVTAVQIMGGGGFPDGSVFVYLTKPFIYMIVDNRTNLPVFIGTVMHPEYAS